MFAFQNMSNKRRREEDSDSDDGFGFQQQKLKVRVYAVIRFAAFNSSHRKRNRGSTTQRTMGTQETGRIHIFLYTPPKHRRV
jgi:hypothetical protein